MNALRGYFQPASKKPSATPSEDNLKSKPTPVAPAMEINVTPAPDPPTTSTLTRTPLTSRPSSIFPDGDFRNQTVEIVLDIKADVMVSWLHQQQVEKLWSTSLPGEGVVLKKARDSFTCCPLSLKSEESGIFDLITALNARVRL